MLKRKIGLFLLACVMAFTIVGCGSASGNSVSDEDLQMLREMRDELKTENNGLKGIVAETDEIAEITEVDASEQEGVTESVTEDDFEDEPFGISMALKYEDGDSMPKYIKFRFWVDDNRICTGDLTKKADVDSWMFEDVRGAYSSNEKTHPVKLSPEHINEVRNMFIDLYEIQFNEYHELFHKIVDTKKIEFSEEMPDSFSIKVGGKTVNLANLSWQVGSNGGSENSNEAELIMITTKNSLGDFFDYYSSIIAEDAGQEFDYGDYSFIDNVIQVDTPDSADSQGDNTEANNGSTVESIIGTWYSTSDATVITFDENGNYTSNNPNTGEHSSLKYYHAGGNRYTAYLEDYFDVDYYLKGDTLVGEEGSYKKK